MTPEPLHRLVYDATIDDAVDVGMRLANRSGAYQRQIRQNILIARGIGACVVIGVAIFNLNEPGELELRPDAVWTRQAGMELVFPWTLCSGIKDNTDDIELSFSAGICVVRNRHLPSPAERARFLETARRLSPGSDLCRSTCRANADRPDARVTPRT